MATLYGTIATGQPDQDGECFSPEALQDLAEQAGGKPITVDFRGDPVGRVLSTDESTSFVAIRAELPAELAGLYVVPGFQYDPKDVTEESGVRVYHRIKVLHFGLTRDPADSHLTPLVLAGDARA